MRLIACAIALTFSTLASAGTPEIHAKSRIDAATVFLSSARVTRVANVTLPEGDVRVLFENVTPKLVDDSLRVLGRGSARAEVYGLTAVIQPHREATSPEVRAARKALQQLQDRAHALSDDMKAAQARRAFVESLSSTYAADRSKNLALRKVSVKELESLADFVASQAREVDTRIRKDGIESREVAERIAVAQKQLAQLQASALKTTKTLAVDLHVRRGGPFRLAVSYQVPQASWQPSWDARLDPATGKIQMTLYGTVRQSSGEEWNDIALSVSTTRPHSALFVPELQPVYLSEVRLLGLGTRRATRGYGAGAMAPPPMAKAPSPRAGYAEDEVRQLEAPVAQASVGLLSTTFTAVGRQSVKGTGEVRRGLLARYGLKAALVRKVAARISPTAYLVATARNETGIPLLGGAANVFLEDQLVGKTQLPFTAAGDEVKLAFGADERVRVKREILERKHDTSGLFSKDDVLHYRIRTTVENLYPRPVAVELLDQVPVSREDEVEVKVLDASTSPTEKPDPMKPGVRTFRLKLASHQKSAVELDYDVSWPLGKTLYGLE